MSSGCPTARSMPAAVVALSTASRTSRATHLRPADFGRYLAPQPCRYTGGLSIPDRATRRAPGRVAPVRGDGCGSISLVNVAGPRMRRHEVCHRESRPADGRREPGNRSGMTGVTSSSRWPTDRQLFRINACPRSAARHGSRRRRHLPRWPATAGPGHAGGRHLPPSAPGMMRAARW